MSLPNEPVIKKFFTNKIESSRADWYEYLIHIARTFYSIDGQEYKRETVVDKFSELSNRSASAERDASNFRDEFGAYGSFLGIFRLEKNGDRWFIKTSKSAKDFLCRNNSNAAAFLRAQLALFQYPNGMGASISDSGSVSVQGNVKADTIRELNNNIRLNPLRLICRTVVALVEKKKLSLDSVSISYPVLLCMFNDNRLNRQFNPSLETIVTVYDEYNNSSFVLPEAYSGILTNFKRNFHIVEKTGLFVRDSRFGLMIAQSNFSIAYECIKTIGDIDAHFDAFDHLYGAVVEDDVRDIIAQNSWGKYYDAGNLPSEVLAALGSELHEAPIQGDYETEQETEMNAYKKAAEILHEYVLKEGFDMLTSTEEIEAAMDSFKTAYSPEKLESLDDDSLLSAIFYSLGDNTNALCYYIENNKNCRSCFGSIAGGSAYKFGLFQKQDSGLWTTGSSSKPQELSEKEALELGKKIRAALVNGVKIIQNTTLTTLADYEKLDADLHATLGDQFYNMKWIHKYYSIICNEKLSCFHSTEWQMHVLRALKIQPSDKYYARSGQIAMIQNYGGWYYRQLFDIFLDRYGEPRQFVRLGTSDKSKNYATEWAKRKVACIGWSELGDLSEYVKGENIDRKEIQDKLEESYFPEDSRTASRKAGEIARFYNCDKSTVFVIMDGERLLALADNVGDYYFDKSSPMAHQKPVSWKFVFNQNDKLPEKSEGKQTSCYQLTNNENLLFLYEKYYYTEEKDNNLEETMESIENTQSLAKPITYHTGLQSIFERNRILFGAPGTGKSFTLNLDAQSLIGIENEDDYERVTFHPDYSYANFVGTYKPVPYKDRNGNDAITYEYVPGPFMRVYVRALKNSQTNEIKPFLLIIEEINRANVAAVFGDIFQLLDRDNNGVSEYPIQATEDMKKYLAKELGGNPEVFTKIRIPDNMFIWATMNSADQGVFPMDTAFKRRWDFTYLGIDNNDEKISNKYVILGKDKSQRVEWNKLRKAINHFLAKEKINEDKQLGPYFISKTIVVPELGNEIDRLKFIQTFKNKVIMYLFEDAAKQKRAKLFEGCSESNARYSEICREFDIKGIDIFNHDIIVEASPEEYHRNTPEEAE